MRKLICTVLSLCLLAGGRAWAAPSPDSGAGRQTLLEIQELNKEEKSAELARQAGGSVRCHKENIWPYDTICTEESDGYSGGGGGGAGLSAFGVVVALAALVWVVVELSASAAASDTASKY